MKKSVLRRWTAVLLALVMACAACVPAMAASEEKSSGTTLGELIEMDEKMLQDSYHYTKQNWIDSGILTEQEAKYLALGTALLTQAYLFDDYQVRTVQDIAEAILVDHRMPTAAQENMRTSLELTQKGIVQDFEKNSLPRRMCVLQDADSKVKAELQTNGGNPKPHRVGFAAAPNFTSLIVDRFRNLESYLKQQEINVKQSVFAPRIAMMYITSDGYAVLALDVIYTGDKPYTLNGISSMEIYDQKSTNYYFAGGSVRTPQTGKFDLPIVFNPGESAVFYVAFAPGTWYDLNWSGMYDSGAHYHVQWTVV